MGGRESVRVWAVWGCASLASSACLKAPPPWLLTRPARPLRTHHTPYLSHTPRLLPSPRRWYPLLQALWNPCLTLAQAAPPLTRFSRTLSWRVLQKRATLMDGLVCLARVPL